MGTGLMVLGLGCMLNDQLAEFNFVPRRWGVPADADFDPGANDRSSLILDEVKRSHVPLMHRQMKPQR